MIDPANRSTLGNRSGLRAVPPGSRQIPVQFLNAIGRAIDQSRIVPGNALAHFETPGGTYLEPTEGGREYLHPFYIQYLGDRPGYSDKAYISIVEGRIMGRVDAERGGWTKPDDRHDPPQASDQMGLGIYGLWAAIPEDGLPNGNRLEDDLSVITLGAGISRVDSIVDNGALVQSNAPIYQIEIGEAWHILCIKAVGRDNDETPKGWEFELVNIPYADALKYYDPNQLEYDPPRIVDSNYDPVRGDTANMPQAYDPSTGGVGNHPSEMDGWKEENQTVFTLSGPLVEDPILGGVKPIVFRYKYRYTLHRLVEVGTYLFPICYHRSTAQGLQIQQVARSDFSFFPIPRINTWSKWAEPFALEWGDTELPPEGGGEGEGEPPPE